MNTINRFILTALSPVALLASSASAVDLFSESFDVQETAKVKQTIGAGMTATFVDYSNLTVGALTHNIAEAPRQISGSLATRGILLKTNYTSSTERAVNLVALNALGTPLSLANNYRLKFDMYLRLSPSITLAADGTPSNTGTTEQMLWGVGYNTALTSPMSRGFRTSRGSGMWGWLTVDGGLGTTNGGDASLYSGPTVTVTKNLTTTAGANGDLATFFTPAFGVDASPQPHSSANQWVKVDITCSGGLVTAFYQAVGRPGAKLFENIAGTVAGGAMVGYEDPATTSTSFDPDNQWMLLDNMVIEDITPPTMVVAQTAAPATYTGTPTVGTFSIQNAQAISELRVTAVSFTGAATSYSVLTPLPLVIPANSTATLEVQFNPPAPNGTKTASMVITSDDPQRPSFTYPGLSARRSVGGFLEAHYKLDETSGTSAVDSSGNGANAAYQIREPVGFGHPSLLSLTDTGTSTGLLPANSGTTGNYFVSPVVHTPTFSISMWVKPSPAVGGATRALFQRDYDFVTTYEKICGLVLGSDGNLKFRVGQTDILQTGPGGVGDDEVKHVVLTHLDQDGFGNTTAKRSRLYLNGTLIAEATATTTVPVKGMIDYPLNPTVTGMHIGSRTTAGSGFIGDMDDIQIYGVELNPIQIKAMYENPGSTAADAPDLKIKSIAYDPTTNFVQIGFGSIPGFSYSLYRSSDLISWSLVTPNIVGAADAETTFVSDDTAPPGRQYYRIKVD